MLRFILRLLLSMLAGSCHLFAQADDGYDDQSRIVAIKREETGYYTNGDRTSDVSNLRVVYH